MPQGFGPAAFFVGVFAELRKQYNELEEVIDEITSSVFQSSSAAVQHHTAHRYRISVNHLFFGGQSLRSQRQLKSD
jgi:hypothetical protein